jgi:predicted ATPase/DNA-binding SARP family transcriptional activator
VQVRVLGEVDVVGDDGQVVRLGSRSQRVVLAALAARPRTAVPADALVEALWGGDPPPSALSSLRTYVSRLRRVLGERLAIGPAGYRLDVGTGAELDAERFELLVGRAAKTVDTPGALGLLDEACRLWRGPAFGDVADVEGVRGEATRLEELRLGATEARAVALLGAGRPTDAVAAAEAVVAGHPLREGTWAVLVEGLAAAGRLPEALRAYQRAATVLGEAGLEPSDRLRRAEAVALAHRPPDLGERPLAVAAASLVGRDDDVVAVAGLLVEHRCVTLVGPGGVGKTRLALAIAAQVAGRHEWGARVVELAGVREPGAVLGAVADGLGLVVDAGHPEEALARAGGLDLLVVLDNAEHLVDAAARTAEVLCAGGPTVRLLVTSREPLGIAAERRWPVAPLPAGDPGSAAFELFVERARAVRPDLALDDEAVAAVARLTARLDGLPLAIEMAATRVATMAPAELAERLDGALDVLVSRRRTAEPRHRTLAAVVAWSERLLGEDERALLGELTTFEGPVDVADVAAVTGRPDPAEGLAALAERSLLVVDASGRRARFGMLRTIRDQAARLLPDDRRGPLSHRHAHHVAEALAVADAGLRGPTELAAHARIDELLVEARAAQAWASRHDPALAARLTGALCLFGQSRRRDEVLSWSSSLIEQVGAGSVGPDGALALVAAAQRHVNRGDLGAGLALARRAVALAAPHPSAQAMAHEVVGDVLIFRGQLAEAEAEAHAGLAVARRSGDAHGEVANLVNLALAAAYGGDHERAGQVLLAAPDEAACSPSDRAWLRYALGEVALDRDPDRALGALDEAVALADAVGNRYVGGVARVSATSLRARCGDPASTLAAFASVIEHWRGEGGGPHQVTTLRNLVVLFQRLGDAAAAAELLGAVRPSPSSPTYGEEAARLDHARAWAVAELGPVEAERCSGTGAARTTDEAAVAALARIRRDRSGQPAG